MSLPPKNNASTLARNVSYSMAANLTSFLVGVAVILLVPKVIGVEEYGYFQLFLFFIGYVGFFHFGWADGIILRYAGKTWESLSRPRFSGQIHAFLFFEIALWGLFALASWLYFGQGARLFVLLCTAVGAVLVLANTFLRVILQAANRIKVYALLVLLERLVYLVCVLSVLFIGARDFRFFIVAYLTAQGATLIGALWFCRDLVLARPETDRAVFRESAECIRVGIKLMLANVASFLILGIIRLGIERAWGIAVFGKISLLLSSVSILFVFVNAASLALLPALRREEHERFRTLYFPSRITLTWFLLISFVFAYPASRLVALWLPAYADSLVYLPLILPVCLFESSVSLLTGTYLKVLRREKDFLIGNTAALLVSTVFLVISIPVLHNLALAVLAMPASLAVRSWFLEKCLAARLDVNVMPVFATEVLASVAFIGLSLGVGGFTGSILYAVFLLIAFLISRKTFWKTPLPFLSFLAHKRFKR